MLLPVLVRCFSRPSISQAQFRRNVPPSTKFLNHVVFVYIRWIVTCYKVCLVDQVCRFDRLLTETQVRHCNTTGLLGVIVEVSLSVHVCIVTDDLDGVLVSTYSTVSSKSPELTVCCSFWCCNKWCTCSSERFVTSSTIPIVNFSFSVLSYTATICAGVVSLEPKSVTSAEP